MTSPRTETTDRPDDSEKESKGTTLSPVQLTAGALSAVSTAVVASFFGVAGTLIGTALASVISTVSATLYSSSLQKTNERLRRVREGLTERQPRVTDQGAAEPATTRMLPADLDPRRAPAPRPRPRWGRVAAYAVGVFAIAMGILTGVEVIGQQPVSALVGASQTTGTTTLGALTNAASQRDSTPSTPSAPTTSSTSAPTSSDGESTEEETEKETESDSDESAPATPTSTSPGSSEEPDEDSSTTPTQSSAESPETSSAPEQGAESTP
jgi:hypothetical protein